MPAHAPFAALRVTFNKSALRRLKAAIGLDVYRLAVSPNGQYIAGITSENDTWQGRIELTRFGPS